MKNLKTMKHKALTLALAAACAASALTAAPLRRLDELMLVEGASSEIPSENAVSLRSSNGSVVSVGAPDGGTANVTAMQMGRAEITYFDAIGPRAVRVVNVVPTYWPVLQRFFEEDPDVTISVSGDRVILSGVTAQPDTLRRARQAVKFDSAGRIVNQVTSSTESVADLVAQYLRELGRTNVVVTAVGHEICLSGKLYDAESIKLVGERVKEFLKEFDGIGVNTDGLKVIKQRISLTVELLKYDVGKLRNLGLKTPDQITARAKANYGYDYSRNSTDSGSSSRDQSRGSSHSRVNGWSYSTTQDGKSSTSEKRVPNDSLSDTLTRSLTDTIRTGNDMTAGHKTTFGASASIDELTVTVNLMKQNSAAKTVYHTTLSTQSGEEAEFQNGGTIHRNTAGAYTSDLKEIEYGFIVKAKPVIVDAETMTLDISLDNKQPNGEVGDTTRDIDVRRYQTHSKYVVRPGESIALSGFNQISQSQTKNGTPFLSRIPLIGRLFQNVSDSSENEEMALIVTVNWVTEDETAAAKALRDRLWNKKAEIEAP